MAHGLLKSLPLVALLLAVTVTLTAQEPQRANPPPPLSGPVLEKHVVPIYPFIAAAARIQGVVVIEANVADTGRVSEVRVLRSVPLLDNAAVDAIRQWEFAPSTKSQVVPVTILFQLISLPAYDPQAEIKTDLPAWMPKDFALVYFSECRSGWFQAETARGEFTEGVEGKDERLMQAWRPSGSDLDQLFIKMVTGGFLSAAGATERAQQPTIQVSPNGVAVTVFSNSGHVHVTTIDGPPDLSPFHQELMVRQYGFWRVLRWSEPIRKGDADAVEAAELGAMVRELLKKSVSATRPAKSRPAYRELGRAPAFA
jgi:TonB family protein